MWPVSGWPTGWPVAASHTRTVLSALPETIRVPSGLNATLHTPSGVPGQRLADGLAGGRVPHPHRVVGTAGDDPRAVGAERHARTPRPVCPVSGWPTGRPVAASHTRTVLSALPETIRVPSGLNATLAHRVLCARSAAGRRVGRWPRPTPAPCVSALPETIRVPSGLNATLAHRVRCARSAAGRRVGRWPRPTPAPCCRHCRRRSACRRG